MYAHKEEKIHTNGKHTEETNLNELSLRLSHLPLNMYENRLPGSQLVKNPPAVQETWV